ncbi:MAG: type II secretion system protein GspK [Candidatus Hydrogenedentes bacterium]|nr:type II secretion system protein GspK [Candidatus Hydrogenedentota bacterium]
MNRITNRRKSEEGSALIFALGVLIIVMAIGYSMYRGMEIEREDMLIDQYDQRAEWVAKSGIETAVAQLQTAIASGTAAELLATPMTVDVPIYVQEKMSKVISDAPVLDEQYAGRASVVIADESAKINLNLAPPTVLMSVLKIDGDKARQIREQLPRIDDSAPASGEDKRHWLATVEELVSYGLVTSEALTAERAADLTVHSTGNPRDAGAVVNINSASSAVIEAALGVTPEVAANVIAARPIMSLEALTAAAGKDPSGFNFKPGADDPMGLPKEISFSSRCFRITSKGTVDKLIGGDQRDVLGARSIEAVVYFPENAARRIVYWNESATPKSTN